MSKQYLATLIFGMTYVYKDKTFTRDIAVQVDEETKEYLEEHAVYTVRVQRGDETEAETSPYFSFEEIVTEEEASPKRPGRPPKVHTDEE